MSKARKIKTRSTADRLLEFRERVRKHYKHVREEKPTTMPSIFEFGESERRFATIILQEELRRHSEALDRAEKQKQLLSQ